MYRMTTSKCDAQIPGRMIICSKCLGCKNSESLAECGLYWRIVIGWLQLGDQQVIHVCKCAPEISNSLFEPTYKAFEELARHTGTKVPLAMSGANARQVGGDHYKTGGEEHWDRVARLGLDYFQAQVTKYVERCWRKNGIEDLKKARHFLDKYIELQEQAQKVSNTFKEIGAEAGSSYVDQNPSSRAVAGEPERKSPQPTHPEQETTDRLRHTGWPENDPDTY